MLGSHFAIATCSFAGVALAQLDNRGLAKNSKTSLVKVMCCFFFSPASFLTNDKKYFKCSAMSK